MASSPYIIGESSPFLKRVLIPFWVLRIIILIVEVGIYSLLVVALIAKKDEIKDDLKDEYNTSLGWSAALAIALICVLIFLVCLILDIVCIIKRARRTLSPPFFLGVNIGQTVFFTINFILSLIGARSSPIGIIVAIIIFLSFFGMLIYAGVVYHHYRKGTLRGRYIPAPNPAQNLETGQQYATGLEPPTAYPPETTGVMVQTTEYTSQVYTAPMYMQPQPYVRAADGLEAAAAIRNTTNKITL